MFHVLACRFTYSDLFLMIFFYLGPIGWILAAAAVWTMLAAAVKGLKATSALGADARVREGRCVECGYDMRATPHRCPECGTPAFVPIASRPSPHVSPEAWPDYVRRAIAE